MKSWDRQRVLMTDVPVSSAPPFVLSVKVKNRVEFVAEESAAMFLPGCWTSIMTHRASLLRSAVQNCLPNAGTYLSKKQARFQLWFALSSINLTPKVPSSLLCVSQYIYYRTFEHQFAFLILQLWMSSHSAQWKTTKGGKHSESELFVVRFC